MHDGLRPNQQTGTSYTLELPDANERMVECANAAPFTLTVPPNADVPFADGDVVRLAQVGDGQVSVTPGAGVTVIVNDGSTLDLAGKGSLAVLYKQAIDTWILAGNLEAGSPVVTPTVELIDDFNRADQPGGLGTSAEGWSWGLMAGAANGGGQILFNQIYANTHQSGFWRAEKDLTSADMFSELQAVAYDDSGGGSDDKETHAVCRMHPSENTFYTGQHTWLRGTDQDEYRLTKRINNVQTFIGTPVLEPHSAYPTTVRLEVVGNQLTLKANGVTKITATDSEIAGHVRAGIGLGSGQNFFFDNFRAGVL